MGGSIGVSALGAALSHQVSDHVRTGLTSLVQTGKVTADQLASLGGDSHSIPDLGSLPVPIRDLYEHAFGDATGHLFLIALPFAVLSLLLLLFIEEKPMRTTVLRDDEIAAAAAEPEAVSAGSTRLVSPAEPRTDDPRPRGRAVGSRPPHQAGHR